jgi:hypothetical protein
VQPRVLEDFSPTLLGTNVKCFFLYWHDENKLGCFITVTINWVLNRFVHYNMANVKLSDPLKLLAISSLRCADFSPLWLSDLGSSF